MAHPKLISLAGLSYRIDGSWKIVNFADTHMACDAPAAKD